MEYPHVRETDPAVETALVDEVQRQRDTLAMIASENHVSPAVMEAQGSTLTNKYAEGYPGERYYAGCENADEIEQLAIERAQKLWGADHVNVQPHSGTQANQAVYFTILDQGDKILSLDLNHGGHLSHGHKANFTGQLYEVQQYEVDPETGYLDYDGLRDHAESFEPDVIGVPPRGGVRPHPGDRRRGRRLPPRRHGPHHRARRRGRPRVTRREGGLRHRLDTQDDPRWPRRDRDV